MLTLNPKTLKQYCNVVFYKARADLKADGLKTYAGVLWWVLDPIMMMCVFYVVFGLLRQRTDDFVPFLLVGLVVWQWWNSCVNNGANAIPQAKGLIRQVYLPKQLFPVIDVLTNSFKFIIVFALLLVFLWVYGFPVTQHYVWLPFLLASQLVLIFGGTLIIAAVIPFIPDLRFAVSHGMRMMFFLSGIFFPAENVPEQYRAYFYANPMANIIEAFRDVLMYQQAPGSGRIAAIAMSSLLVFVIGWLVIHRFDRVYPKVIN